MCYYYCAWAWIGFYRYIIADKIYYNHSYTQRLNLFQTVMRKNGKKWPEKPYLKNKTYHAHFRGRIRSVYYYTLLLFFFYLAGICSITHYKRYTL